MYDYTRRISNSITPRQLEVPGFLAKREHWSVGEVATTLGVSSAAATKAIARLERKGLVTRTVDVMDRRCVNVRITRAGSDALRQTPEGSIEKCASLPALTQKKSDTCAFLHSFRITTVSFERE